jgi:hypothetical protein
VVVDLAGSKQFQGDLPRMALSRCSLEPDAVVVTAPGFAPLRVPRRHDGPPARVAMYKHEFSGIDAGDEPANWLSELVGQRVRLVKLGPHWWRGMNPVHVLSLASLAALNEALRERGDEAVELERFRPNLVLGDDGTLPAFFEEHHDAIAFGPGELRFREPCVRCELPNISRLDASRGRQPLKLIGALSRERPTTAPAGFGIYARLAGLDEIREGARGTPLATRILAAG